MFKIFSTYICRINKKMQHLEVSGAVRPLKWPLGVKWLRRFGIPLVTFKRAARKPATGTVVALCPPPQKKKFGHSEAGGTPEPVQTF